MSLKVMKAAYFNAEVDGDAAAAFRLLSVFAGAGVNLLAFKAVPLQPNRTRFTIFPNDSANMADGARKAGLRLDGPRHAVLIQGDDEPGALAAIYRKLSEVGVEQQESSGFANIQGRYGVVLYLTQEDCDRAVTALNE
jgi:hypothetical protein